jgi:peptidoglycan/xylan/chitin deacetylase (PgdA/CDA1 family)
MTSAATAAARASAAATAGAAAAAGAAYWLTMSPYSQALGPFPYRGTRHRNVVALTFDDGPNEPYTSQIAEFLGERDIRATFFQVGRAVLANPAVTRRLAAVGHVIGNHGFTHEFTNYLSRRTVTDDVRKGQAALATAGLRPALYRPPWLLRIPALTAVLRQQGLRPVSGECCDPFEVCQPRPALIAERVLTKAGPGSIIIFHDGFDGHGGNRASTVAAVKIVVDRLSHDGLGFVTVDDLLGVPAYQDHRIPSEHG